MSLWLTARALLQMLNIHLRGQEVPACNAGKVMQFTVAAAISLRYIGAEVLRDWLWQTKQMIRTVW